MPKRILLCLAFSSCVLLFLGGCSNKDKSAPAPQTSENAASQPAPAATPTTPPPAAATQPAEKPAAAAEAATAAPAAAAPAGATAQPAAGAGTTHDVAAKLTSFEPMIIFIKPGDTVRWIGMQAGHNSTSIDGMIPDGAQSWRSVVGQDFSVTLTKPGAYIYKCEPHFSLGMLGAIVVGDTPPANLAAIESSPLNTGQIARVVRKLKQALAEHK